MISRRILGASLATILGFLASPAGAYGFDPFVGGPEYATPGGGYTGTMGAAAAGPTTFRVGNGRLAMTLITAVGTTGNLTFFDNATACSGTVLAVVPGASNAATVGQLGYASEDEVRFVNGLTACGATGSPGVTLTWW